MALCVTDGITEVAETEIIELVSRSLKKPTRVEFRTNELPKSPVGKLQRKVLREAYWTGEGRRLSGS